MRACGCCTDLVVAALHVIGVIVIHVVVTKDASYSSR